DAHVGRDDAGRAQQQHGRGQDHGRDPARQPPETPSRPSCDNAFRALHRGAPRDENCPAYHAHYHRRVAEGKSKCGPARRTSVIPKGAVRCRPGRGAEGILSPGRRIRYNHGNHSCGLYLASMARKDDLASMDPDSSILGSWELWVLLGLLSRPERNAPKPSEQSSPKTPV